MYLFERWLRIGIFSSRRASKASNRNLREFTSLYIWALKDMITTAIAATARPSHKLKWSKLIQSFQLIKSKQNVKSKILREFTLLPTRAQD